MRAYKAARRVERGEPVEFNITYEKAIRHRDEETGRITGTTYEDVTEHFVCRGDIPALLVSEMSAQEDLDAESPEGIKLLRMVFATAFDDDDEYQRFFRVATRYLENDQVFDVMVGLMEDFSGRPTTRSSVSSDTPSETTASGQHSRTGTPLELTPAADGSETARVVNLQQRTVTRLPEPTEEQRAAAALAEAEAAQASSA